MCLLPPLVFSSLPGSFHAPPPLLSLPSTEPNRLEGRKRRDDCRRKEPRNIKRQTMKEVQKEREKKELKEVCGHAPFLSGIPEAPVVSSHGVTTNPKVGDGGGLNEEKKKKLPYAANNTRWILRSQLLPKVQLVESKKARRESCHVCMRSVKAGATSCCVANWLSNWLIRFVYP